MERIASIIEQIQQAFSNNASPSQLLVLTDMLRLELQQLQNQTKDTIGTEKVAVVLPSRWAGEQVKYNPQNTSQLKVPAIEKESEKITEVLQVNEEEVEAELEEIRKKAEFAKKMEARQVPVKPVLLFEEETEIPTLVHQPNYQEPAREPMKEVNESVSIETRSLNDSFKQETREIAHKLTEEGSVKDLKKAIGINDRFVFINELFRGDEVMYERSIKTINGFSIYPEAQYWMERELKIKLGWDDKRPATQEFYSLVKRRFS